MRRRTVALSAAVVLALMATALVWWYVASVKQVAEEDANERTVLVARADIPARTKGDVAVSKNLVTEQKMARDDIAPGALNAASQLQGKIILASTAKGQQIVASQIVTPEDEGLSFRIPKGMRAAAVSLDRVAGVGGMIRPGDRVDVLATFKYEVFNQSNISLQKVFTEEELSRFRNNTGIDLEASKAAVTKIVLSQVEVVRIDPVDDIAASEASETLDEDEDAPETPDSPVAVLLVTPEDSEKLVFAELEGEISLALVPAEDETPSTTPGRAILNVFAPSTQQPVRMNSVVQAADAGGQ